MGGLNSVDQYLDLAKCEQEGLGPFGTAQESSVLDRRSIVVNVDEAKASHTLAGNSRSAYSARQDTTSLSNLVACIAVFIVT